MRKVLHLVGGAVLTCTLSMCGVRERTATHTDFTSDAPVSHHRDDIWPARPLNTTDFVFATPQAYTEKTGDTITAYSQSPYLDQAGLAPVDARLPEQPLVILPVQYIGAYGGMLTCLGAFDYTKTTVVMHNHTFTEIMPWLIRGWQYSDDYSVLTLYLREGLRWSDGEPFTVDDILFTWHDVMLDTLLTPRLPKLWLAGGEPPVFERADDYTLRIRFPVPNPLIIEQMSRPWQSGMQSKFFDPKHYLRKWHLRFNPSADSLARSEGYSHWYEAFLAHQQGEFPWTHEVGTPTLGAYIKTYWSETHAIFVRNPYFFAVDTKGNQLPYIDSIMAYNVPDEQATTMKVIAGEVDVAPMATRDFPLLKMNQRLGGYRIILMEEATCSYLVIGFNCNHKDPGLRDMFLDVRFRRAMSVAINRDEINDIVFFGKGTPMQATVHPTCSYYRKEWGEEHPYLAYDPPRAEELLDEMGMGSRDEKGYRLRPDGKPLTLHIRYAENYSLHTEMLELIREYWQDVGLQVTVKPVERSYYYSMVNASEHEVGLWVLDPVLEGSNHTWPLHKFEFGSDVMGIGIQWGIWWKTGGQGGETPPAGVRQFYDRIDRWMAQPTGSPEYLALADSIMSWYSDNLWEIGTVGMPVTPVVLNPRLRNVDHLQKSLIGFDTQTFLTYFPIQFFFEPQTEREG